MGLINKLRLNLIKRGKLSLKDLSVDHKFDEDFVESCIEVGGVQEFQYASEWLKTDANFILRLIEKYPAVLQYCSDEIVDRYDDENRLLREVDLDKFYFYALCCDKNLKAYKYIDEDSAKKYMEAVKNSETITGEFNGKEKNISLINSEFMESKLLNIRYDIIRLGDLTSYI